MFNKDFYPTPDHVIDMMGIDCRDKVVLEPSAGKGNIVNWLKANGAAEVLACEKNEDLAQIVKSKARLIGNDFLNVTAEQISHVNMIVMNPPFSADETHILHAWEIAPPGCEIISLSNWETLASAYTGKRRELQRLIRDNGTEQNLGDVFANAERKTGVEIGLVRLFKPSAGESEFEGFFMEEDEEQPQENGVMRFDAVRDIVQRYVYAVKCWDEYEVISNKMAELTRPFKIGRFSLEIGYDNEVTSREAFKKELQKRAWKTLFHMMNLNKYVTSGVMKDINKFVEQRSQYPFTMKNIYHMFDIIVGTREQTFDKALVEAVDNFTMHTNENRFNVEGWKTNAGHMLNKKFIVGWTFNFYSYTGYLTPSHGYRFDYMQDLTKVLCALTGENYDKLKTLYNCCRDVKPQPNEWFNWDFEWTEGDEIKTKPGFFKVKGFKKGTMHVQFQDPKVWELLNRRYAKIKGQVLPEKFQI